MNLANFVTSVTKEHFLPVVVDNWYNGNVLFMRLKGRKKAWKGGTAMKIPTEIAGRNNMGSYAGADTFATGQEDVRQQFSVTPSQYYANVTITGIQAAANKGPEAIVDLLTTEFKSVSNALMDNMGVDLYQDGTGNNSKDLAGLLSHVDDGTNVATYQGLSRTTYTTLQSTVSAQAGALGLDDLAASFDAAQVGSDQPTLGITTPAVFSIYEALLTSNTRYTQENNSRMSVSAAGVERGGISANAGYTALQFRGIPIVSDDKCPSGNLFFLNEKYLDVYEMSPASDFVSGSKDGFAFTGWKKPSNQDVIVGQLLWYGQLVGSQPRKHARRTAITS
jgi:hypothetical protein